LDEFSLECAERLLQKDPLDKQWKTEKREIIPLAGRLGIMVTETGNLAIHDGHSTVSWKAVLAGGIASLAITLILLAFGIGVGFSVVSPWANTGVSATTFTLAAAIYLIVVAMLSSTIGGYIAGRMRSQWQTVHEYERYFRDTAHGFLVWALATVVSAAVLGGATTNLLSGASAGLARLPVRRRRHRPTPSTSTTCFGKIRQPLQPQRQRQQWPRRPIPVPI
jgi:hypothetical protein